MQKIELETYRNPLYCLYCGKETIGEEKLSPCEHVLFIATSEAGMEYCSEKLDKSDLDDQVEKTSWEEVIDKLDYPDSFLIELQVPAPAFFSTYVGYAVK